MHLEKDVNFKETILLKIKDQKGKVIAILKDEDTEPTFIEESEDSDKKNEETEEEQS